ncbi:DUF6186 family protein [Actinopolymorpha sp. B11F2]|uniref:DUF6186 family protein n=1 Tax=Actinopolymorpha sp. B11F2 TaxID=3160862 RepID=UPI0032E3852A
MTTRLVVIAGFVVLFLLACSLVILARIRRVQLATLGEALAHVMVRAEVRILVLCAWAWLGWHALAR